jgi:hypothetical protein
MQLGGDHHVTDVKRFRVNHGAYIGVGFRVPPRGIQLCRSTLCRGGVRIAYSDNIKAIPQLIDNPDVGTGPAPTSD